LDAETLAGQSSTHVLHSSQPRRHLVWMWEPLQPLGAVACRPVHRRRHCHSLVPAVCAPEQRVRVGCPTPCNFDKGLVSMSTPLALRLGARPTPPPQWCSGKYLFGGTHGEPIMGVWGQSPQRRPGAEPLVGVRGAKPPEAEKVLRFGHAMETANLPYNSLYFGN